MTFDDLSKDLSEFSMTYVISSWSQSVVKTIYHLKCLWTESCFSLVLKFAFKNTFPKFEKSRLKINGIWIARPKYVTSTSDVTLVPQSFSQYSGQERKEAARAEIRRNPRNTLISESLDMFANKTLYSANKLMATKWHDSLVILD